MEELFPAIGHINNTAFFRIRLQLTEYPLSDIANQWTPSRTNHEKRPPVPKSVDAYSPAMSVNEVTISGCSGSPLRFRSWVSVDDREKIVAYVLDVTSPGKQIVAR